jgi:COMPASS component SWD2
LKPAKVFKDAVDPKGQNDPSAVKPQITSIAFNDTGDRCLSAAEDDSYVLWDTVKGK